MHKILTLMLSSVIGTAVAADLPDCQLDGNALVSSVMERSRLSADWSSTLMVTDPLRVTVCRLVRPPSEKEHKQRQCSFKTSFD